MLRFDWTTDDRDGYESLLNYLIRKHRCGVIDEQLPDIKDFYLVPLMVDQEVPGYLLPFSGGPGIPYVYWKALYILHNNNHCDVCTLEVLT